MTCTKPLMFLAMILWLGSCAPNPSSNQADAVSAPQTENDKPDKPVNKMSTHFGLYVSKDLGVTWTSFQEGLPDTLRPTGLGVSGDELVLATENAGLFITKNKRASWKDISLGLATKRINTLYISGDEIFVGLYHEGIAMRTMQAAYWNNYTYNLPNRNVRCVVKIKDELLVGTDTGLFKSSDQRSSWTGKVIGKPFDFILELGDILVAGNKQECLQSNNAGESWKPGFKGKPIQIIKAIKEKVFMVQPDGHIMRSEDGGHTWHPVPVEHHSQILDLAQVRDQLWWCTDQGVFISDLQGQNWNPLASSKHHLFLRIVAIGELVYGSSGDF